MKVNYRSRRTGDITAIELPGKDLKGAIQRMVDPFELLVDVSTGWYDWYMSRPDDLPRIAWGMVNYGEVW